MIVKMMKATILVHDSFKKEALANLRKLGVVHINPVEVESEELSVLLEKKSYFEKALKLIPVESKRGNVFPVEKNIPEIAERIYALHEELISITESLDRIKQEYDALSPWGDFDPDVVRELKEKGVDLHFCRIRQKDIGGIPGEIDYIRLDEKKERIRIIIIGDPSILPFSYDELPLPGVGMEQVLETSGEKERRIASIQKEIKTFAAARNRIEAEINQLNKNIEFEQVRAGMAVDEQIAFLSGFVPVHFVTELKKSAAENGWGLILDSPGEEDQVPTLLKNPKWVSIVNPVFDFFGTVPGYHESDISFWFLLFFSLFFAMIIGDAGYGFCILVLTLIARIKMKKAPAAPFVLFTVMGISTMLWGAITGTWFGVEQIARLPFFSWMIIDNLASFPAPGLEVQVQQFFMSLCFTIAIIHLTVAHILNFIKQFPHLKSYANIGKILLLWGLYFAIQTIVFKKPMPFFTIWLVGIGLGINFIFIEQNDNFFKGLLSSARNFIPIVLNSISCFSDIISYVRLFAVGLATVKVAEAFNEMAAGAGVGPVGIILSIFILIFGHSLNMVMAGMSVMVHGVRLNMLEFSGHMDLQWSGSKYKPFS